MFGSKKRICARCDKKKVFKATIDGRFGRICDSGHLICSTCSRKTYPFFKIINPFTLIKIACYAVSGQTEYKTECPVCSAKLRKIAKDDLEIAV